MSKFIFRLETMLKLRERMRDQCLARMQQAEEAVALIDQQANSLTEQMSGMGEQATSAAAPGEINVDMLVEYKRYGMVLQAQLHQLRQQREKVHLEAERRRGELTEADRELKVLEKLKERRRVDHTKREHYADIKQLDEIAGRRGARPKA